MAKDDERTLTPKLRFPEFRNNEGWNELPIGDKVDLLSGYPFDGADISDDSSGTRLLRGVNITEGTIRHSPEIDRYFLGHKDELKKFELAENDLVIGMDGSKVGKNSALISRNDAGALLIQRVARLRTTNTSLITFIFLHVNSPQFHRYVDKINTSSGIPHISAKQIQAFRICFPSESEQKKIVDCLTSLDELIAAQGRKVEALKAHKNGLMQQLFPREGETLPRLRFPEFDDAMEWEKETLENLFDLQDGFAFKSTDFSSSRDESVQVVRISDINNKNSNNDKVYVSNMLVRSMQLTRYVIESGDMLLSLTGAAGFKFFRWNGGRAVINQRTSKISAKKKSDHALTLLLEPLIHHKINARGEGQNNNLSKEFLSGITMSKPQPAEQQRIADCLSTLDARIAAEANKLASLKTHKTGLMQQLFPNPQETVSPLPAAGRGAGGEGLQ